MFEVLLALTALVAGSIAAISGFGIGSLITPVLAWKIGTKIAVAAVAIPHFTATGLRLALMWKNVDRDLFVRFGLLSAAGGLAGALLQGRLDSRTLTAIFAALLLFAGISELFEKGRLRIPPSMTAAAGVLSGLLGGLVGNQGGIRAAAMLGSGLSRTSFVATATAVGMVVDLVRLPIYLATSVNELRPHAGWIVIATISAVLGTVAGRIVLHRIPEKAYRKIVAVTITVLGVYMAAQAVRS